MKNLEIVPSLLGANFLQLDQTLANMQTKGLKWFHYDVMDHDFVPNLTFGSKVLTDICQKYSFLVDIHFMVKVKTKNFEDFFQSYLKLKPAMMTMHCEAMNAQETSKFIKLCQENKIKASLAISPKTPIRVLEPFLSNVDNVLVMSVEPGFGGQQFLSQSLDKIQELANLAQKNSYHYTLEIDGGVNADNFAMIKKSGVDLVVIGSYLFNQDLTKALKELNHE